MTRQTTLKRTGAGIVDGLLQPEVMWLDDFPAIRITGEARRERSLLVGRAVCTDFLKTGTSFVWLCHAYQKLPSGRKRPWS